MENFKRVIETQTIKNYFLLDESSVKKQVFRLNQEQMLKRLADYKDHFSWIKKINNVLAMLF